MVYNLIITTRAEKLLDESIKAPFYLVLLLVFNGLSND